jgi:DNA-directed RNA polymerase specialized sigma24 family protein
MNLAIALPVINSKSSDDVLLAAIATGDRAAFGILYSRHVDGLRAVAAAALPQHLEPDADDVVQNVFIAILEGRAATFQPALGKGLAWLKGMVRREAAAYFTPPPNALARGRRGVR